MTTPEKPTGGTGKVRYAVVGLGNISRTAVLPAFAHAENAQLTALVSGSQDKREALAAEHDVPLDVDYDDFDELCGSGDIDAVYLGLPNHLHCDFAVRAARAGIHVLCEKPMAVTEAECETMVRAAREHDVRLMIAYRLHFEQANLDAIDIVGRGELGEVRLFEGLFSQTVEEGDIRLAPLDEGGGTLYDLGVYCINAARYLFRCEPDEVSAVSVARPGDGRFAASDEMTAAVLHFPDERLAVFTTSFGGDRVNRYTVVGSEGTLVVDPAFDYETNLSYEVRRGDARYGRTFPPRDQFGPQLAYFSDCIREHREPEPGGLEGWADIRIVRALYQSARIGEVVRVEPISVSSRPTPEQAIHRPSIHELGRQE